MRDRRPVRVDRERRTLHAMLEIYCRGHHRAERTLCDECRSLYEYATGRLERCPLGAAKTTCGRCPVHCYKPAMRERIRAVMRYAGPRMAFRHPLLALLHVLDAFRRS